MRDIQVSEDVPRLVDESSEIFGGRAERKERGHWKIRRRLVKNQRVGEEF